MKKNNFKTIAGLALFVGVVFLLSRDADPRKTAQAALISAPAPAQQIDRYGVDLAKLKVKELEIARSETFSEILRNAGLNEEAVQEVLTEAKDKFDVSRIREGQHYRLYSDGNATRHLVYQQSPIDYVHIDLSTDVKVLEASLPVEVEQRTIGGNVEGSLRSAIAGQGADPNLAGLISDVFQWQVDFFHLKRGDSYKVVYEQKLVDGAPVGLGKVISARMSHDGKDYFAFHFKNREIEGYYDEFGQSLQQAFLQAPVKFGKITSEFSNRRFHPVLHRYKAHLGTDFAAPHGTEIMAVGEGEVLEAGWQRGNGNYVKISHNATYATGYLHMSRIARGIRPGVRIKQGQIIGYVGSTGYATGPHVCFRFWKNGKQVDPQREEMPKTEPIPEEYKRQFYALRDRYLPMIREDSRTRRPVFAMNLPDVSDLFAAV